MSAIEYTARQRASLLSLARQGVCQAVAKGYIDLPDLASLEPYLQLPRASFVTLDSHDELRGCIGSLQAVRPLAHDVLHNACGAALHDYRFAPLQASEPVSISVSILSPLDEVIFSSEADLLHQLVPGRDGVLLQAGRNRATFLPVVWEGLTTPDIFLRALKRKAALAADYWSDQVRVWRYESESFAEDRERPACE
ncbi:AmmeMemoRadiSam system protein A [Marinobacterium marinum]|uniref:AmmeMemoRadiSam system protein A n=1 Tax=Marinobacterium marinum TaxID=2756129 RepID=A0A7W2AAH1_9GAMM|nr:AmmeMemoRadiSam system protein A [Marinobacterium marinum]MBA4501881.1 AmmeMemoRadiSam system protein A [Marinobacterium marinum]